MMKMKLRLVIPALTLLCSAPMATVQAEGPSIRAQIQSASSPQNCISGLLFEAFKDLGLSGRTATTSGKMSARVGNWTSLSQERYLDGDYDHGFVVIAQEPDSLVHLSSHTRHKILALADVVVTSANGAKARFKTEIGVELKNTTDARGANVVRTTCAIFPRVSDGKAKLRIGDQSGNDSIDYPRFR